MFKIGDRVRVKHGIYGPRASESDKSMYEREGVVIKIDGFYFPIEANIEGRDGRDCFYEDELDLCES